MVEEVKVVVGCEVSLRGRRREGGSRQSSPLPGLVDTIPLPSPYAIYAAVALRLPTDSAGGPNPQLRRGLTPRQL